MCLQCHSKYRWKVRFLRMVQHTEIRWLYHNMGFQNTAHSVHTASHVTADEWRLRLYCRIFFKLSCLFCSHINESLLHAFKF